MDSFECLQSPILKEISNVKYAMQFDIWTHNGQLMLRYHMEGRYQAYIGTFDLVNTISTYKKR